VKKEKSLGGRIIYPNDRSTTFMPKHVGSHSSVCSETILVSGLARELRGTQPRLKFSDGKTWIVSAYGVS